MWLCSWVCGRRCGCRRAAVEGSNVYISNDCALNRSQKRCFVLFVYLYLCYLIVLFCFVGNTLTEKASFHLMHLLWIIKFACICMPKPCYTTLQVHYTRLHYTTLYVPRDPRCNYGSPRIKQVGSRKDESWKSTGRNANTVLHYTTLQMYYTPHHSTLR